MGVLPKTRRQEYRLLCFKTYDDRHLGFILQAPALELSQFMPFPHLCKFTY